MIQLPPMQQARCLGETIEYGVSGEGAPTIVLVNGSGGPVIGWHKIFGPLSSHGRVFAYNRPGIGASSRPAVPQTGSHLVSSLRAVLQEAGCAGSYVLVGHSFGGLIVNLFARLYPHEVAAVVMLEATTVDDIAVLPRLETKLQRLVSRIGKRLFPPDPDSETVQATEIAREIRSAPAFPPVPLIVVAGTKPALAWATAPEALAARQAHQRKLAALSPSGRFIEAARSGHFPQFSEPELVVGAIKDAIALSRAPSGEQELSRASAARSS